MFNANALMGMFEVLTVVTVVAALVYLVVLSALVHDTHFILAHPVAFAAETAAMFALPGLPVLMFMNTQGVRPSVAIAFYVSLGIKFAIFHILFHLSGMYRRLFLLDYPMR